MTNYECERERREIKEDTLKPVDIKLVHTIKKSEIRR